MNTLKGTSRITREEVAVITLFALICFVLGAVSGWSTRVVSSRDKFLVSTAQKHFSEAEYYQAQINQIIKEGSKPLKGEK